MVIEGFANGYELGDESGGLREVLKCEGLLQSCRGFLPRE
jgi:hypothetical protein